MCGFVGSVGAPVHRSEVKAALGLLAHRGPDSEAIWQGQSGQDSVSLGFRRLRILDLSPAADQPMTLGDLRLVFNGEIYNFQELRRSLEGLGHAFKTTGDTEVILAAYRQWGLSAIVRLEGMFSLALWDRKLKRLVLARDRLGIKPLYWARSHGRFLFASEPKAIISLGRIDPRLDRQSLLRFLTFLWVPDPDTMFEGIHKLPPGHICIVEGGSEKIHQYWDVGFKEEPGTIAEHAERLGEALKAAVKRQVVSDVPLGVFLSGGVDSTMIASMAAGAASSPMVAVATGYKGTALASEPGGDDLAFAGLAARRIPNLDYHEIVLSTPSAGAAADLARHFDDPVADPAAIAAYLICQAAKPHATVMLSGVGAEELFGGYPRHRLARMIDPLSGIPQAARAKVFATSARLVPGARPGPGMQALRHLKKGLEGLGEPDPYIGFCAHHNQASLSALTGQVLDWGQVLAAHTGHLEKAGNLSPLKRALYLDLKTYLPCLNLAYVDRSSMACSVEVRVPMLDEGVVERAMAIPDAMKAGVSSGKLVLKRSAAGTVPEPILKRPKTGFGAPVRTWMREFKSELVADCLSERSINNRGWVRPEAVAVMRRRLRTGASDQALQLWSLVTLELWARTFLDQPPA